MNLFFGQIGTDAPLLVDDPAAAILSTYSVAPIAPDAAAIWHHADGAVLGHAKVGDIALSYIGVIPKGAPDWASAQSPLDRPDETAAYLISRYKASGPGFLNGVPGTYALVLSDGETGKTFLATDPAGAHSLFLRRQGQDIAFATNLGVMATVGRGITLDRGLEDFLLGYQFLPDGRTVFKDVMKLPAGTLMEWHQGEETHHQISGWSGDAPDLSNASEDEIDTHLYEGFMQALEDVAPSDSKVAVVLGGFDSALVASGLRRMGREVHTFTFHFDKTGHNQPNTDTLTREIGSTHHWVKIDQQVISHGLKTYGTHFNQTAVQPHYPIESVEVCRKVREHGLKHALTGDGCDGLFLGYPTIYRRTRVVARLSRIPKPLLGLGDLLLGSRWLEGRFGHPYRVARNLLNIIRRDPLVRDHFAARALDTGSLNWARGGAFQQEKDVEDILTELAQSVSHLSTVRRAYHSKALAGSNRNKMEGCLDVAGVAMISPYTHPRFAKMAGTLDDEKSRPENGQAGLGKHALMRMAENSGLLSRDIIHQPKRSPAEAPVDTWYMGELRSDLQSILDCLPFELDENFEASLFRPKFTENMYRQKIALDVLASHALMALVTYAAFAGLIDKDAS